MDRRLRTFTEESASAVVDLRRGFRGRVYSICDRPKGTIFIKAVEGIGNAILLANEAQMLREVGPSCAPKLLYECVESEAGFIVTEAVHADERRVSMEPDPRAIELLDALPQDGEEDSESHPWIASVLTPGCPADVVRWSEALRARRWPVVVLHGDLWPGNVAVRPNGEYVLLDWERGSLAGFPGVDAARWFVDVGAWLMGASTNTVTSEFVSWASGRGCNGTRMTRDEARAVLALTAYWLCQEDDRWAPEHVQQVRLALWKRGEKA